jgi:hypothetical protein
VSIATTSFASLAKSLARSMGIPELPMVVVAHPLGGIPEQEVRGKARSAIAEVIEKATKAPALHKEEMRAKKDSVVLRGSVDDVILEYYRRGWTDGLPIRLPTDEAVGEMLRGTDLPRSHLLGIMVPKRGQATVEKIAVNAVMAGCRPTYMPVLIGAVEGLLETDFDLLGVQSSTGAHSPLVILNGPIRRQIRVNCSSGALGPGWQANASIGRAIRLILNNVGGAKIGMTDMTTLGMAENFTYCLGENEEKNPWEPFHVEQGFEKEESTVSVVGAYSPEHVSDHVGVGPKEILAVAADVISRMTRFHIPAMDPIISRDSILILCPEHADSIAKAGWTKNDVQKFVSDHAQIPYERLKRLGRFLDPSKLVDSVEGQTVPLCSRPDGIKIIVAGGPGKHSAYINSGHSKRIVTKRIVFPRDWDRLIEQYRE